MKSFIEYLLGSKSDSLLSEDQKFLDSKDDSGINVVDFLNFLQSISDKKNTYIYTFSFNAGFNSGHYLVPRKITKGSMNHQDGLTNYVIQSVTNDETEAMTVQKLINKINAMLNVYKSLTPESKVFMFTGHTVPFHAMYDPNGSIVCLYDDLSKKNDLIGYIETVIATTYIANRCIAKDVDLSTTELNFSNLKEPLSIENLESAMKTYTGVWKSPVYMLELMLGVSHVVSDFPVPVQSKAEQDMHGIGNSMKKLMQDFIDFLTWNTGNDNSAQQGSEQTSDTSKQKPADAEKPEVGYLLAKNVNKAINAIKDIPKDVLDSVYETMQLTNGKLTSYATSPDDGHSMGVRFEFAFYSLKSKRLAIFIKTYSHYSLNLLKMDCSKLVDALRNSPCKSSGSNYGWGDMMWHDYCLAKKSNLLDIVYDPGNAFKNAWSKMPAKAVATAAQTIAPVNTAPKAPSGISKMRQEVKQHFTDMHMSTLNGKLIVTPGDAEKAGMQNDGNKYFNVSFVGVSDEKHVDQDAVGFLNDLGIWDKIKPAFDNVMKNVPDIKLLVTLNGDA